MHYNEPHRPYYPPLGYLDHYTDETTFNPADAGEFSMEVHRNLERFISTGRELSADERTALVAMYDAEIEYTDRCVGSMIKRVKSLDDRDVIFVVTSDHGELFGEYDLLGHKLVLHDELTHVPMVVSGLPNLDSTQLTQHNDVMKTILDYIGEDSSEIHGINLYEDDREYVVSQHHETDWEPFLEHNPDFDINNFHSGDFSAIRTHDHRFQMGKESEELFEVTDGTTNILDSYPDVAKNLRQELRSWLEAHCGTVAGDDEGYSEDMRDHLADMGYVE